MLSWNFHWVESQLLSDETLLGLSPWTWAPHGDGRRQQCVCVLQTCWVCQYMCKGGAKANYCRPPHLCLMQSARCKRWVCCLLKLADGHGRCSRLVPQLSLHGIRMALCFQGKSKLRFLQVRTFVCAGIPDVGNMRPAAWISLHAPLKKLDGSFFKWGMSYLHAGSKGDLVPCLAQEVWKKSSWFGLNFTMIFRFLNRNLGVVIRIRTLNSFKITLWICDATVSWK